jgi:SAM-dependent methyltransferase
MRKRMPVNEVIWHEVECGGYSADLPLWEELADAYGASEPIMELGCGAGRVTRHLARRGAPLVIGVDNDRELVEAVWETHGEGVAEFRDVRNFSCATQFNLVLAPMQLIQLLAGGEERISCLSCTIDSMLPGGRAALAIVEETPAAPAGAMPPLPDVRQIEGWIYSSLPLVPEMVEGKIVLRRLRQTVDPEGAMTEQLNEVELCLLSAETLEEEARSVGLEPIGRRRIPATEAHVGSTVVLLGKEA